MSREDIVEYARRYVPEAEQTDFPMDGDLFCLLQREIKPNETPNDKPKWDFAGYGYCLGYLLDDQAKPTGKWIWMSYVSLDSFPPSRRDLKLQPPHIVKGSFQSAERTTEIKIVRIAAQQVSRDSGQPPSASGDDAESSARVLRFPGKRENRR